MRDSFSFFCLVLAAASVSQLPAQVPNAVPRNVSEVTATVLACQTWPAGAFAKARPVLPPEQMRHSVTLKILASKLAPEGSNSHATVGQTIEAFTASDLGGLTPGQKISATVVLVGDEREVRWSLREFQPLPQSKSSSNAPL